MIKASDFIQPCGCRSAGECTHGQFAEIEALYAMVDAFASAMKSKLRQKFMRGCSGWDDPARADGIRQSMIEHASRGPGQEVDVANLAAMLWNMNIELASPCETDSIAVLCGTIPMEYPPPHASYLIERNGVLMTATPCYGMHAPWWVVKTLAGEADPALMQDGDKWNALANAE